MVTHFPSLAFQMNLIHLIDVLFQYRASLCSFALDSCESNLRFFVQLRYDVVELLIAFLGLEIAGATENLSPKY